MQRFVELALIEGYDKNTLSKVKAFFTYLFTYLLVYLFASWHIAEVFFSHLVLQPIKVLKVTYTWKSVSILINLWKLPVQKIRMVYEPLIHHSALHAL